MVNDAIGELTNMTVGVFKNAMSDAGLSCRLTIPSILRGSNFTVASIDSATRHTFCFECSGKRMMVDILMKMSD
jgi:chemotaxis protein CheX